MATPLATTSLADIARQLPELALDVMRGQSERARTQRHSRICYPRCKCCDAVFLANLPSSMDGRIRVRHIRVCMDLGPSSRWYFPRRPWPGNDQAGSTLPRDWRIRAIARCTFWRTPVLVRPVYSDCGGGHLGALAVPRSCTTLTSPSTFPRTRVHPALHVK